MEIFTKSNIEELIKFETVGCICVSLFMPTFRTGRVDVQQNVIRLKALLESAKERLGKIGLKRTEADDYLQPVYLLLDDSSFWLNMGDGLAVFFSKDYFKYYRLAMSLPELLVVANRFHTRPLLPLLAANTAFYVVAISQHKVRLLRCNRFSFDELDIKGKIPLSLSEALQFDDIKGVEKDHAHYSFTSLESGSVAMAHNAEIDANKNRLLRFFYQVDKGLQEGFLRNETAPLVVACVDYLFPIYKKANSYKFLFEKAIEGNPDRISPIELQQLGIGVIEPSLANRQEEAIRQYIKLAGLGRTTDILERIVSESYHGKVKTLFITENERKWGKYDSFDDKVEVHDKEQSCDIDLVDFIAAQTLAKRGEVHVVTSDMIPGGGLAAAILRY
jgi:hypothetical protein